MNIASRRLWGKLVGIGYFPEELPACFSSMDLEGIVSDANFNIMDYKTGSDSVEPFSKLLPFSIPHTKGYRRLLSIPGPFHYSHLCFELIKNKAAISRIHTLSQLSIYEDYDDNNVQRYISKPDFKRFTEERILKSSGYRYLLNVDVTRFYSSIYTHSIPWAIHTKATAKSNNGDSLFGNLLDKLIRNCQDRQTMGIPIGPDSSRIISEIILSKVDEGLQNDISEFKGIRNVDDYYLFFKTHADAEKGRASLQRLLRAYELELNVTKERIVELPDILEGGWKGRIRSFKIRSDDDLQRRDLIAFFDMSFSLARLHPNEMILPYAIAKLRSISVARTNWRVLQAFLLNAMVLESKVVVQVVHLLLKVSSSSARRRLDKEMVKDAFDSFIEFHLELGNHYEIVWALWFYYQVEYELSRNLVSKLNTSENDMVILLLLALEQKELTEAEFDKSVWRALVTTENLFTEHWLIAYEGVAGRWLKRRSTTVVANSFFGHLLSNEVRFFKPDVDDDEDERIEISDSSLAKEVESFLTNDDEEEERENYGDIDNLASNSPSDDLPF